MRRAQWALVGVLVLLASACAGGADKKGGAAGMGAGTEAGTVAGAAGVDGTVAGTGAGSCGNGVVEMSLGEQCEPSLAVPVSCQSLGMGTGMVMCSNTCRLYMMCSGVAPVAGNSGAGLGGAGG